MSDNIPVEIVLDENITALKDKLKLLDDEWAEKVAEKINDKEKKTLKKPVNKQKIYNIANLVIKTNTWKIKFMLHGAEVLKELQALTNKANNILSDEKQ